MEWDRMTMAQNALQYNIVKQNGIEQMGQIEEQEKSALGSARFELIEVCYNGIQFNMEDNHLELHVHGKE